MIACAAMLTTLLICSWPWRSGVGQSEAERSNHGYKESQPMMQSLPQIAEQANDEFDWQESFKSLPIQKIPARLRERAALYEPLIHRAAAEYGVDSRILWVIAFLETRFQPDLVSPVGARGLMQFMPATAERYDLINPENPAQSIEAAARYVRDLQERFGNRFDLILAGYNAGEGAVDAYLKGYALRLPDGRVINPRGLKLGGIPPYAETKSYVARGLELARLLGVSNFNPPNLVADIPASTKSGLNRQPTIPAAPKIRLTASIYAATPNVAAPTKPLSEVADTKHRSFRASDAPVRQCQ
jgi:hypothetical protein